MLHKSRTPRIILRIVFNLSVYAFFLAAIPALLPYLIPCMKPAPGATYTLEACASTRILDAFLAAALAGQAILGIMIFLTTNTKRILVTTLFLVIASGITIGSYYYFARYAEKVAAAAPVMLYDPDKVKTSP